MKSKLLIGLFLGLALHVSAQEVGIRAGMDLYKFRRYDGQIWNVSEKFTASPNFGLSFRMPFKERSAFRTGIFYSNISNEMDGGEYKLSQQFLKIPIQYGFTVISEDLHSGFFLGPILGYGLSAEYSSEGTAYNLYKDETFRHNRLFPGLGAGFRVEYMGFSFTFQYNADILIPKNGFGSERDLVLGNEIISVWLGYSYNFAKKSHKYARRK